jgi:Zn-dependent protease
MLMVFDYPALFVGRIVALIVALSIHEFAHALAAFQLGDTTAARSGRLTLNPLAHLDPIGSLMMIMVGFGWARPVPVNPANLRGDKLRSMGLTAAAGPISNVLQAFVFALPIRFGLVDFDWGALNPAAIGSGTWLPSIGLILSLLVWMNLLLALFNLIPLGPLDGMKVLLGILPSELSYLLEPLARYGTWLLLPLMILGGGLIGRLIFPPAMNMLGLLTGMTL